VGRHPGRRSAGQQATLERASSGDEQAFGELTAPYRRELLVHCYRMLGSLTDAEDVLQETLLAAWRGLDDLRAEAALRPWLYRIATSRCLNSLRAGQRRIPAEPVPPFAPPEPTRRGEITWLQPYPDAWLQDIADSAPGPEARYQAAEAVKLAFITALQRMPPRQAAALLLRDVLGFSAAEAADMLGTSPTAIKGIVQRARASLTTQRIGQEQARPGSAGEHDLAARFARAYVAGDVDGVVALLTDDAWLSMPPAPHEYQGPPAIAAFLRASFGYRGDCELLLVPAGANGQPAFGSYLRAPGEAGPVPAGLIVLTTGADGIRAITRFHVEQLYPRFGLPITWSSPGAP
jgi:RNA polymerase sigma-70 factor (TIGR02960 family)